MPYRDPTNGSNQLPNPSHRLGAGEDLPSPAISLFGGSSIPENRATLSGGRPDKKTGRISLEKERSVDHSNRFLYFALIGDILVIANALTIAFWLRWFTPIADLGNAYPDITLKIYLPYLLLGGVSMLACLAHNRIYNRENFLSSSRVIKGLVKATTIWMFAFFLLSLTLKLEPDLSRLYILVASGCSLLGLTCWRILYRSILEITGGVAKIRRRAVMIGWNGRTAGVAESIKNNPECPYHIEGYLGHREASFSSNSPHRLGDLEQITDIISNRGISVIIASELDLTRSELEKLTPICEREHVDLKIIPAGFSVLLGGLQVETIGTKRLLGVSQLPLQCGLNPMIKRLVDIIGGFVGLILSLPLIMVFGLLIKRESPGPCLFSQMRYGRNGKPFVIYKLRSMALDAEASGGSWTFQEDPRRLKIGGFMRRWNVDELPQFWNVIKGEMSLVGPRPEVFAVIDERKDTVPHYNARHEIKPGLTGLAQVSGLRGDTDLQQRIERDLHYIENWNVGLDFKIMLKTFIHRKGAG